MQKILVVDDHSDIQRLMAISLEDEFEVLQAADGVQALALIRQERPFVVLMDIMMPGELDGLDVLRTVRADPQTHRTLVALISARGQASDLALGEACGADAYFAKPFSPLQVVRWVLKQSHLQRERLLT